MSGPNDTAKAAMGAAIEHPVFFAFLDILGDPKRVTTAPYSVAFPDNATGDGDLDGHTFLAIDPEFVSISDINNAEGGGDTVTCTLSGMVGLDLELMNQIGNKANWQGRVMRIWETRYDENLDQIGNIWPVSTCYMTVPKIAGDRTQQTIVLDGESYLSFLTSASNRSYLDQADFDPNDQSAAASIACANGTTAAGKVVAGTLSTYNINSASRTNLA